MSLFKKEKCNSPKKSSSVLKSVIFQLLHPHPRQGVPRRAEAFVLFLAVLPSLSLRYAHDSCLIVASAPLTLLRIAIPNPAGLVEVLHIVFVPSAAQAKVAAIRRYGRSQALPYANELPQLLPGVRGLTTPFRSDGQTIAP